MVIFLHLYWKMTLKFRSGPEQTPRCIDLIHEESSCIYHKEENLKPAKLSANAFIFHT